jgi:hypothetical protein
MPPDQRFGPAQLSEIPGSQVRLAGTEKFVELWRLDRGAAEHGMHLSTMVNLMFEQM